MRHAQILILASLLAGACSRGNGAQPVGCGTKTRGAGNKTTTTEKTKPSKPPAQWTLEEMAGVYAWGCSKDKWSQTTLSADGEFTAAIHGKTGDLKWQGKIVRDEDKLTLSDKPAHLAGYLSHFFLRHHGGRKVLVREDGIASFDLSPSWLQAEVRLKGDEDRGDLCDEMPRWPKENPPDPEKPKARLPASFTLTFPVTDPGGTSPAKELETQRLEWRDTCDMAKELETQRLEWRFTCDMAKELETQRLE